MFVEAFSSFFMSTPGAITTVVIIMFLTALFVLNMHKSKSLSVQTLAYAAVCIALATVLSNIKLFPMPQGGTVTACSMLFVALIGYWFGLVPGLIAAFAYGMLQMVFDPYIVHPLQMLLDYPLGFGVLGLSGLFRNSKYGLYKGYALGALARWVCSTLSGVIFFYEYAGDMNPWIYSMGYNMSYIAPEMIITMALISIGAFRNAINHVKSMAGVQGA